MPKSSTMSIAGIAARIGAGLAVLAALSSLGAGPVAAAPASASFTVNTTADAVDAKPGDGQCASALIQCSLRAAIQEANALKGVQPIILPLGAYQLSIGGTGEKYSATGDLNVRDNLIITGAGANVTSINANGIDGVIQIAGSVTLTMTGVTLTGGNPGGLYNDGTVVLSGDVITGNINRGMNNNGTMALNGVVVANTAGQGIVNAGRLSLEGTAIFGNVATGNGVVGGGIDNYAGVVAIDKSSIYSNHADAYGGGLYTYGAVTITNSSVYSNTSDSTGAGLYHNVGIGLPDHIRIANSTFSGNISKQGGGAMWTAGGVVNLDNVTITGNTADVNHQSIYYDGGGLAAYYGGVVNVKNSLIARNYDGTPSAYVAPDCYGSFVSQGHNFIGSRTGCSFTAGAGDQVGTDASLIDPMLSALQWGLGPTPVHVPLAGSPVIDAGDPAGCDFVGVPLLTDQRGATRYFDGDNNGTANCDIGAIEYGAVLHTLALPLIIR